MRFILLVRASNQSESGVPPPPEMFATMMDYNESLANAGMLLAGEGIHPSAKGARIRFGDGNPVVTPGPFLKTNELICGYWVIQAKSTADAIDWAKRAPFPEGEIEVRQIQELEDFGTELPSELRHREMLLRDQLQHRKAS